VTPAAPVKTTDELEAALGHTFRNRDLLTRALTHRSSLNEPRRGAQDDNERMEFLGDAVLNLAVSEALIDRRPEATEGALSKWRARLVSEPTLARVAARLGIGRWLRLGRGEELSGGREKRSLLRLRSADRRRLSGRGGRRLRRRAPVRARGAGAGAGRIARRGNQP
jgi:dsRNA-specific ribonuclease